MYAALPVQFSASWVSRSCRPGSYNELGEADVVRVELVNADKDTNSERTQSPPGCRPKDRELAVMHVVDYDLVEAHMTMYHHARAENRIEDRVARRRHDKRCAGNRYETG